MTKQATQIRTMDELKARKSQLEKEIEVSQQNAKDSVTPVKNKTGAFVLSKAAPVLAVGVGLFIAFKLFGGKEKKKTQMPEPTTATETTPNPAYSTDRVHYQGGVQRSASTSSSFISIIRGLLPFAKVVFPLLQTAFANYQAARAAAIAKNTTEGANG